MSSIVDKAFDATQKIMRTIFRGSPNLFTTADLNRQIEAFDYRLKRLEWFRGIETDMTIEENVGAGYHNITFRGKYLRVFGCTLFESDSVQNIGTVNVYQRDWSNIYLYLSPTVVTYQDDPGHTISGAVFSDGTSMPSADNLQITAWGFCRDSILNYYEKGHGLSPLVNDGSYELSDDVDVPLGALLLPILSTHTDDGTTYTKWFYRDAGQALLKVINNFYPEGVSVKDDEGGFYIDEAPSMHNWDLQGEYITNGWFRRLTISLKASGRFSDGGSDYVSGIFRSNFQSRLSIFAGMAVPVAIQVCNYSGVNFNTLEVIASAVGVCRVVCGKHPERSDSVEGYFLEFSLRIGPLDATEREITVNADFLVHRTISSYAIDSAE